MKENCNIADTLTYERLPTPSFSNSLGKQSTDTEIFSPETKDYQFQEKKNLKIEIPNSNTQKNLKQFPCNIFPLKRIKENQNNPSHFFKRNFKPNLLIKTNLNINNDSSDQKTRKSYSLNSFLLKKQYDIFKYKESHAKSKSLFNHSLFHEQKGFQNKFNVPLINIKESSRKNLYENKKHKCPERNFSKPRIATVEECGNFMINNYNLPKFSKILTKEKITQFKNISNPKNNINIYNELGNDKIPENLKFRVFPIIPNSHRMCEPIKAPLMEQIFHNNENNKNINHNNMHFSHLNKRKISHNANLVNHISKLKLSTFRKIFSNAAKCNQIASKFYTNEITKGVSQKNGLNNIKDFKTFGIINNESKLPDIFEHKIIQKLNRNFFNFNYNSDANQVKERNTIAEKIPYEYSYEIQELSFGR